MAKLENITGMDISNTLENMRIVNPGVETVHAHIFVHERAINRIIDALNTQSDELTKLRSLVESLERSVQELEDRI